MEFTGISQDAFLHAAAPCRAHKTSG
jgi:hypothetical protein